MAGNVPDDRKYTDQHEWARKDGDRIVVGITYYAQEQLGDIVFVGLPETGAAVTAGESFGEVESTKSVSDVYSPVTGTVAERNAAVEANPELINNDPYGQGWLVALTADESALEGLMSAADYEKLTENH